MPLHELRELPDPVGHLSGDGFDRLGVVDELTLLEGVGGVNRLVVLGVAGAEGGVDAAGARRVGVPMVPLADHQRLDAPLAQRDRGPCAGCPRATTSTGTIASS